MKTYALIGPSGTGKSHRAQQVVFDNSIDLLIDDGLIIKRGNIVSGISAKKQNTKLGAIKTALFTNEKHRQEAIEMLKALNPKKVLILGTSKDMTEVIADRLQLALPDEYVSIYDIATPKEINKALYVRNNLGRHLIPAPTFEVKKNLPETVIEPLHMLISKKDSPHKKVIEQSVTQPTYTPMGNLFISNKAIEDLVHISLDSFKDISSIKDLKIKKHVIGITISLSLNIKYGAIVHQTAALAQKKILQTFDDLTNLPVEKIDITVSNLSF